MSLIDTVVSRLLTIDDTEGINASWSKLVFRMLKKKLVESMNVSSKV